MKSLEETLRLHRFYNSCQEFESWMEDKENVLNTISIDGDDLGVVQAKYEVTRRLYFIHHLNVQLRSRRQRRENLT